MTVKPFVKWAGGKSQLLADIRGKYPAGLGRTITRYCEPFVGGGAVLFDMLSNYRFEEVLINDINAELINTYLQIKKHVGELIGELQILQDIFWSIDDEERKWLYYEKRERFNYLKVNGNETVNLEKAALFVFLNKTCFNGLFRVNRRGLFNVPVGGYQRPVICDVKNLRDINLLLQNVTIKCGDYKECFSFADARTFFYLDPPYRPITETASFTSYAESPFGDDEQLALGRFVNKLNAIGVSVVVSNSDPKNSDEKDDFFDELYKAYSIVRVSAKRMINCNGNSRGNISELLITNF